MNIIKEYKNIKVRAEQLVDSKDPVTLQNKIIALTKKTNEDGFWDNSRKAGEIMTQLGNLNDTAKTIQSITVQLLDIKTFFELKNENEDVDDDILKSLQRLNLLLKDIELDSYFSGKFDKHNTIFSIHAGQGGTEAQDWAAMLERMYLRFFEIRQWKVSILARIVGEEAGIKSVTLQVNGENTYGYLKHEHGTHRLVRVSPFNAQGLRQTSFAGVEVSPLIEDDMDVDLNKEDIDFTAVRAGGPGGQNVNKTSSSVRIVHRPTGIVITSSTQRSQLQNRKQAMDLLRAKLYQRKLIAQKSDLKSETGEHKMAAWSNQIRNYVLNPYKLVKDLRTNVETTQVNDVLDGKLKLFIQAELKL